MLISGASSFITSCSTQLVVAISSKGGVEKKNASCHVLCICFSFQFLLLRRNGAWLALSLWYFTACRWPTLSADAGALTARQQTWLYAAVMEADNSAECVANTQGTKSSKGFKIVDDTNKHSGRLILMWTLKSSKAKETEQQQVWKAHSEIMLQHKHSDSTWTI